MSTTTCVVICAYTERRWNDLVAAVASVHGQTTPPKQFVVVVDDNPELLARALLELADVQVIANSGPKGLSGARNTALAVATADVIAFLDDDAVADPDWLARLTAPYADPRVLGVGGSAWPAWDTGRPAWWPDEFGWVVGCSYTGQPDGLAPVRNLMGCNMSMRRDVFEATGGFNTALGRTADTAAGCEETEWCIRASARRPGGVFLHEPAAVVHHRVPATRARWSYFRTRCIAEGYSKARMSRTVGASAGLAVESTYVRKTLPTAVLHDFGSALRGDLSAAARAAAIVAGLSMTAGGYAKARIARPALPSAQQAEVPAVLPMVVDLEDLAASLAPLDASLPHRSAWCLVTRGGSPLTKLRIKADDGEELTGDLIIRRLEAAALVPDPAATPGVPGMFDPDVLGRHATVVIATRDRPDQLVECLDSVLRGSVAPQKVIVVDNAPSDERTAELMAQRIEADGRLAYVREDRPGLANAHNAALPHLTTRFVAFTDDDVVVERRWLERLVLAFHGNDGIACVTGMIAPRELETLPQQWVEGNATYDKGLQKREFDASMNRKEHPLLPYASGACGSGANMAFRTSYLRGAGGFDPALGTGTVSMGGDDLAAFYDVLKSGQRLVYEPAAIVLHPHHRDYSALRRQTYGYGAGLGAHLTRCLLRDPKMLFVLLGRASALRARAAGILNPPQTDGLPPYPKDLRSEHLRGLLSGPGRYLKSQKHVKRMLQPGGVS